MPEETAVPAAPAPAPSAPVRPAGRFEIPADPVPAAPEAAADAPSVQNTGDQATPAKPEEKPEEVETPEQAAKREGRRFGRKLDKAYRERAEAVARSELLQKQIEELRQQTPNPAKAEGEPRLEHFDYDPEKYATAKAEYAKTQAGKELAAKQRTEAGKAEHQRLMTAWEEKVERAEDKYEDFSTVVGDLQPNSPFVAAIMEAENGEDIAYHLGKNPKEIHRIAKLGPLAQAKEIGRLEERFLAKPVEPKAPSKAPAPIAPLTGASPVKSDAPSETDDMRDWMRKRQKQVHGKR